MSTAVSSGEDAVSTAVADTASWRQRPRLHDIDYFISADEQPFFRAGRCSLPTSAGRYSLRFSEVIANQLHNTSVATLGY